MIFKRYLIFLISAITFSLALICHYIAEKEPSPQEVASTVSKNLGKELKKVETDFEFLKENKTSAYLNHSFTYPVFIFQGNNLVFYSDNKFVPVYEQVLDSSYSKLINLGSEVHLLIKKKLADKSLAVAAVKLLRRYPINNDYLSTEYNKSILPGENVSILEAGSTLGQPVCVNGNCLFRISFIPKQYASGVFIKVLAFILYVVAFILFTSGVLNFVTKRFSFTEIRFITLLILFLGVRVLMTRMGFPGNLLKSSLFDPQYFASSALNASLGDLILNLICVLILGIVIFKGYPKMYIQSLRQRKGYNFIISIFSVLMVLFAGLFPIVVIQTLYNNSTVNLEIAEVLNFNMLRLTAFLSVVLSGVISFLFSHVFIRTFFSIRGTVIKVMAASVGILLFIAINQYNGQLYLSTLLLVIIYAVVIYGLHLHKGLKRLSFNTFAYLFIAIFILATNGALAIQHFSHKKKIETQFRFAENFLVERDYFGEYLLNETSQKISKDAFIQSRISNPFLGKETIRQKIRQVLLPNYFNKYDVQIALFNALGDPIDNKNKTFSQLIAAYDKDAYKTEYEGVRFINSPASDVTQRYLIVSPIKRAGQNSGYVVIELSLKKIIPENVYPELLVDYRFQDFYKTQDLSYAVFINNEIAFSSGDFNYENSFDRELLGRPALYSKGINFNHADHIAVEDDENNRVAIVSGKELSFNQKLGNFSLLLVLGLFTILLLVFILGVYQYFHGTRLFFSARIQLYLNLAFFIPLIIVSVSTLSLTSRSSQQQLNQEYISKSKIFSDQISNYVLEDSVYQNINTNRLTNRLTDLAKISNLDANIFSRSGILLGTSQPLIYESNLLSTYINPKALQRMINGESLFIESENVGKLEYYAAYSVLKSSQNGTVLGIISIPFFQSINNLNKVQSVILVNILNIFAFIFIILLLLSYLVAERLTFPLRFITASLRKTSLTKNNTPLTWTANDEIGIMVKEYNAMLFKLSESKLELENTQREKAWREIAQQVAHEIKNPLTPMKLTLQQLERAIQTGKATEEKTQKAISALLTQVDTLNDIASSFSGFVKMPDPVIQLLDLVSILKQTIDLHAPTGEIVFKTTLREAMVLGDSNLLGRTFSNIILNAQQAARAGYPVKIQITLEEASDFYKISFADNGTGIPVEVRDRVFLPHFSTKKTGSGLGLAISKQAIEQMKGKIWFETAFEKGTIFYILLPISKR